MQRYGSPGMQTGGKTPHDGNPSPPKCSGNSVRLEHLGDRIYSLSGAVHLHPAKSKGKKSKLLQRKVENHQLWGHLNTPTEARFAPIEGELLGITKALHMSRYYVMGHSNLHLITDHKPLERFGTTNTADPLSRAEHPEGETFEQKRPPGENLPQ